MILDIGKKIYTSLSTPTEKGGVWWKYGLLAVVLLLIINNLMWYFSLESNYPGNRYGNLITSFMLLLNHLAFSFTWPRIPTFFIRLTAIGWLIFTLIYVYRV
jgi:hypothetical protein